MKFIKSNEIKVSIALWLCSLVFVLSGCGGSSSSSNNNVTPEKSDLSIMISSPSQYPTATLSTMPIVVNNYGESGYNNLNYVINQNTTGSDLVISQTSLDNCKSIPAGGSCILNVQIPASTSAGAFNLLAQDNSSNASVQSVRTTTNQVTGLTNLPPSNGLSGIDGVTFYYNKQVTLPTSKTSVMLFTMVVTSTHAGDFNTLDLVDSHGNSLSYQVLTGNSGDQMSSLVKGSIVTLAVAIPSGASQLAFYPSLKLNGTEIDNGKLDNPINIPVLHASVKQANIMMVPSNFALNSTTSKQNITLFNSGTIAASTMSIAVNEPIIIDWANSTCTNNGNLAANSSCTYSVIFPDAATSTKLGTGAVALSYNNGVEQATTNSNYTYRGANSTAGVMISSTSNPRFYFSTSTSDSVESTIVTLTNIGSVDLNGLTYDLPDVFSVVNDDSIPNQCGADIVLSANLSCNLALVYTNNKVTPNTNGIFKVSFGYTDPTTPEEPKHGSSEVGISYNTIQSQAILTVNKSIVDFGNILNDGIATHKQSVIISNIGEISTNGAITLSGLSKYYSIINNTCTDSIAAGSSCTVELQAGPIDGLIPAGELEDIININYFAYDGASISQLSFNVVTQVVTAGSAVLDVAVENSSGMAGGNGTLNDPYQLENNTVGTVSYTITNSGSGSARHFAINNKDSLAPWHVQSDSCSNGTIRAGSSCIITFAMNNSVIGAANLNINNLDMVWTDDVHPLVDTQSFAQFPVYANVFPKALITINQTEIHLLGGESHLITATLSGGYNVSNQNISLIDPNGGVFVITPNSCVISKNTSICTFEVYAVPALIDGNYTLNVTNSGNVRLSTSTIIVHVSIANTWAWMSGESGVKTHGVYGQKNVPSVTNMPGSRSDGVSWVDSSGNLWLFGGFGYAKEASLGDLNDLWKYNPSTNEWTWVGGSDTLRSQGVYGVKGQGSVNNIPGARENAVSWVDKAGNLWLFGGDGYYNGTHGTLNDLWKYNIISGEWTWMSGESVGDKHGIYGTKGVPSINNIPGSRHSSMSFIDNSGNLWLFGGFGYAHDGLRGSLNDLWKYDITTNEWVWVSGDDLINQTGTYGTKGTPSINNIPTARSEGSAWVGKDGAFWLFGGDLGTDDDYINDLWKYDPSTNEWTWVSGSDQKDQCGTYGQKNIPNEDNVPGARDSSSSWVDSSGNLWLFAGYGYATEDSSIGRLNDLWRYNPTTNEWTWIHGANSTGLVYGQYGIKGQSGVNNFPGSRLNAVSWVDNSGNFWLFGGFGSGANKSDYLNDLWKYTPPQN